MSVTASAFHPLIRPKVPSCPIPVIDVAIRSTAADFCKKTKCWREQITITHEKEWTSFGPTMPTGGVLHELESAWWDTDTEPLTPQSFGRFSPEELASETGVPEFITQITAGKFRLVPRADGTLVLNVIVAPPEVETSLTVTLPNFMSEVHGEAIAAGALARVLALPGEWSDTALAAAYGGVYEGAVAKMTGRNVRGQQKTRLRARSHFM